MASVKAVAPGGDTHDPPPADDRPEIAGGMLPDQSSDDFARAPRKRRQRVRVGKISPGVKGRRP
jgi:hypothetical protein